MEENSNAVENFFGVYLLLSKNPKFEGRTYIGFTVDPNRRIKQHNNGVKSGGAYRTSNKGPWEMVLIVHGFSSDIAALRFEWAWQNPHKSRRLKLLQSKKKSKESKYDYCLRILATMLQTRPWKKLPLTLRWLKQDYYKDFSPGTEPPIHMPVVFGPVMPMKVKQTSSEEIGNKHLLRNCYLCTQHISMDSLLRCLSKNCSMISHTVCLAKKLLKSDPASILPVEGTCPKCDINFLWGDIVRMKNGCYQQKNDSTEDTGHWTASLTQSN